MKPDRAVLIFTKNEFNFTKNKLFEAWILTDKMNQFIGIVPVAIKWTSSSSWLHICQIENESNLKLFPNLFPDTRLMHLYLEITTPKNVWQLPLEAACAFKRCGLKEFIKYVKHSMVHLSWKTVISVLGLRTTIQLSIARNMRSISNLYLQVRKRKVNFAYRDNDTLVQFHWLVQLCLTLRDPVGCSTSGFPVHHQFLELAQTHVHRVSDATQPSHSLSSPSPAFNLSQHQNLFQWLNSSH